MYMGYIFSFTLIYFFSERLFGINIMTNQSGFGYFVSFVLISIVILLLWIWMRTGYEVDDGLLTVKTGPFRNKIKIKEIKRICPNKLSIRVGPALSREVLEIQHGQHSDVINISPKNEVDFIEVLVAENPDIEVDEKLRALVL